MQKTTILDKCGVVSNDAFIWTHEDPDLELVEPRLLVSIDKNYLSFSRNINRPAERHAIKICNHGDFPVAFKIETTDNLAYFMDQVYGVIPAARMHVNPAIQCNNIFTLQVNFRPYSCHPAYDSEYLNYYNAPRKDKLFILLVPYFNSYFSPAAMFHNDRAFEKLRVLLHFTGLPATAGLSKAMLIRKAYGWTTWKSTISTSEEATGEAAELKRRMLEEQQLLKDSKEREKTGRPPTSTKFKDSVEVRKSNEPRVKSDEKLKKHASSSNEKSSAKETKVQ